MEALAVSHERAVTQRLRLIASRKQTRYMSDTLLLG